MTSWDLKHRGYVHVFERGRYRGVSAFESVEIATAAAGEVRQEGPHIRAVVTGDDLEPLLRFGQK